MTNVLNPKLLSAERWTIERMYLHMKKILALNDLFNASPAAVGQQVYATAILYNALGAESQTERIIEANPNRKLNIPEAKVPDHPMFRISLEGILVQERNEKRRKRRFCKARRRWTTYKKIPGGKAVPTDLS